MKSKINFAFCECEFLKSTNLGTVASACNINFNKKPNINEKQVFYIAFVCQNISFDLLHDVWYRHDISEKKFKNSNAIPK